MSSPQLRRGPALVLGRAGKYLPVFGDVQEALAVQVLVPYATV